MRVPPRIALQQSERCAKALDATGWRGEFLAGPADSVTTVTRRHDRGLRRGAAICESPAMAPSPFHHRQRSSTAIVMTRPDPLPVPGATTPPPPASERDWQWLWWIPLALLVAGAWALLLFGDSFAAPPVG